MADWGFLKETANCMQ